MIPLKDNIPSRRFPIMNYLLILANTVVFMYEITLAPSLLNSFIKNYAVIPLELINHFQARWQTIFTAMFLHGGWFHFLGNMLFLYIFGDNVEDRLGHIKYLLFYLFCGAIASFLQIFFMLGSSTPLIGASGAIAGVLGAYFCFFPYAKILTLIPFGIFTRIVEVPAFFFLALWFLFQMTYGVASLGIRPDGGVAWWAHIGGFLSGYIFAIKRGRRVGRMKFGRF